MEVPGIEIISPTKFIAFKRVSNWSVYKFFQITSEKPDIKGEQKVLFDPTLKQN
jgi:hypothetical protein